MAELILYACPVGPLADAIEAYWGEVVTSIGPNAAHDYMPHVTLTGFFDDVPEAIHGHVEAMRTVLQDDPPPADAVVVTGALYQTDFHLLTVESTWCRSVARRLHETSALVRLKDRLHVSLAYGFPLADGATLARLGRAMVDPTLPAVWDLRFYERLPAGGWLLHGAWPLQSLDGSE